MTQLSDLVWPPTNTTITYEQHRERLSSFGNLNAGAIIKSDETVKVTITGNNVYTISSNLTLKAIKTTIDTTGKIKLSKPCYGVFEVLYNDGVGFVELDLYDTNPPAITISADKLEIIINESNFFNVSSISDIFIKVLTVP